MGARVGIEDTAWFPIQQEIASRDRGVAAVYAEYVFARFARDGREAPTINAIVSDGKEANDLLIAEGREQAIDFVNGLLEGLPTLNASHPAKHSVAAETGAAKHNDWPTSLARAIADFGYYRSIGQAKWQTLSVLDKSNYWLLTGFMGVLLAASMLGLIAAYGVLAKGRAAEKPYVNDVEIGGGRYYKGMSLSELGFMYGGDVDGKLVVIFEDRRQTFLYRCTSTDAERRPPSGDEVKFGNASRNVLPGHQPTILAAEFQLRCVSEPQDKK